MKIYNFKKLLSYIKKQKKKRKEEKKKNTFCPESSLGISTRQSVSLPLRHYWKVTDDISLLVKLSPWNFGQRALYKVDRALLNTNSKILFRRGTTVLTVQTERKRISSHLKNRFQADTVWTLCSYLKVNYPKSLPFVLKKVLFSKFIAKSTYRLLKRPQKKNKPIEIWPKQDTLRCCMETQNASHTRWGKSGHYRNIYPIYTSIDGPSDFAGR